MRNDFREVFAISIFRSKMFVKKKMEESKLNRILQKRATLCKISFQRVRINEFEWL